MNGLGQLVSPQEYAAQNLQLATATDAANRQNALSSTMQQYGAAAARGDRNALAAIAQIDPGAAQELSLGAAKQQGQRLSNDKAQREVQVQNLGVVAGLLNAVGGDPERLEYAKQFAVEQMGMDPKMVQGITMDRIPQMVQGILPVTEQLETQWDKDRFMLTARETESAFEKNFRGVQKMMGPAAAQEYGRKFSQAGGLSSTNINTGKTVYGKPPSGFRRVQDPNDPTGQNMILEPEPGSDADVERTEKIAAAAAKYEGSIQKDETLISTIDDALSFLDTPYDPRTKDFWATGVPGQVTEGLWSAPSTNLSALISPLESNIGFDRLQQMREESPTGGALGAVSERELRLLTAAWGSLEQAQSPEQLKAKLEEIKGIIASRKDRYLRAYITDVEKFGRDKADRALRAIGMEPPQSLDQARNAISQAQTQQRQEQGVTGPDSGVSADDRFQQLLSEGLDARAAGRKLLEEGYRP